MESVASSSVMLCDIIFCSAGLADKIVYDSRIYEMTRYRCADGEVVEVVDDSRGYTEVH